MLLLSAAVLAGVALVNHAPVLQLPEIVYIFSAVYCNIMSYPYICHQWTHHTTLPYIILASQDQASSPFVHPLIAFECVGDGVLPPSVIIFLDAIASPSTYPCQSVGQWVSQ